QQRRVLLVAGRRPAGALDVVALAQCEPAHLAERDVDVLRARQVAARAQEAIALVAQVEQPLDGDRLALVLDVGALLLAHEVAVAAAVAVATPAPAVAAVTGLGPVAALPALLTLLALLALLPAAAGLLAVAA